MTRKCSDRPICRLPGSLGYLDNGNAQTKADVRWRMQFWQTDGDLAGLREPRALEALPADERKECLALWQEVAAVLSRVQTTE